MEWPERSGLCAPLVTRRPSSVDHIDRSRYLCGERCQPLLRKVLRKVPTTFAKGANHFCERCQPLLRKVPGERCQPLLWRRKVPATFGEAARLSASSPRTLSATEGRALPSLTVLRRGTTPFQTFPQALRGRATTTRALMWALRYRAVPSRKLPSILRCYAGTLNTISSHLWCGAMTRKRFRHHYPT